MPKEDEELYDGACPPGGGGKEKELPREEDWPPRDGLPPMDMLAMGLFMLLPIEVDE